MKNPFDEKHNCEAITEDKITNTDNNGRLTVEQCMFINVNIAMACFKRIHIKAQTLRIDYTRDKCSHTF